MNSQLFLQELAETLEVEAATLTGDYRLDTNGGWSSLAVVATIALIDEHFDVTVSGKALRECVTVDDLLALIHERMEMQ